MFPGFVSSFLDIIQNLQSFGFQYPSRTNYHSPADGVLQMICNKSCINIFHTRQASRTPFSSYFSVRLYLGDVEWQAQDQFHDKLLASLVENIGEFTAIYHSLAGRGCSIAPTGPTSFLCSALVLLLETEKRFFIPEYI